MLILYGMDKETLLEVKRSLAAEAKLLTTPVSYGSQMVRGVTFPLSRCPSDDVPNQPIHHYRQMIKVVEDMLEGME
jgi:hypothetical protein